MPGFIQATEKIETVEPYSMQNFDAGISHFYNELSCQNGLFKTDLISWFSEKFLGCPYKLGACGEGPSGRFDQNPLYRLDAFDCVTFVNFVLALALSTDLQSFQNNIVKVGYRDFKVNYLYRHHFMSTDWNPCNEQLGIIKDVTETIVDSSKQPLFETAKAWIDKPNWFRFKKMSDIKLLNSINDDQSIKRLNELQVLSSYVSVVLSQLNYLPLSALFDNNQNLRESLFRQIPSPSIIEIIRPNWDLTAAIGTHLNVSHLGFVIHKNNEITFRHASSIEKKIVDVPLVDYLRSLTNPTIKGIHILKILR